MSSLRQASLSTLVLVVLAQAACVDEGSIESERGREDATQPLVQGITGFEEAEPLAGWTLAADGAAQGTLTVEDGIGHAGRGARLRYDFRQGGKAIAVHKVTRIASAKLLGVWLKVPHAGVDVSLRVFDSYGEMVSYLRLPRPFQAQQGSTWLKQVVNLSTGVFASGTGTGGVAGVIDFPITKIGLVVRDPYDADSRLGELFIDDLHASTDDMARLDLSAGGAVPVQPAALSSKLTTMIAYQDLAPVVDTRLLDQAKAAGFTFVRVAMMWRKIEKTQGVYDFSEYQPFVDQLLQRGLKAHFTLDHSPSFYASACTSQEDQVHCGPWTDAERQAYARFLHAAASRFSGKGFRYELWNEANNAFFWRPAPDAVSYAALVREATTALRAGDPSARIATSGLAPIPPSEGGSAITDRGTVDWSFLRAYLSAGISGSDGVMPDGISIHKYRRGPPETFSDDVFLMRSIVKGSSPEAPPLVWQTEAGYSASWSNEKTQAVRNVRQVLTDWILDLPSATVYRLRQAIASNGQEGTDGLLRADGTEKEAYKAVKQLSEIATGRRLTAIMNLSPTSVHGLRLTREGALEQVYVLWSDRPGEEIDILLPAGGSPTAEDYLGRPLTLGDFDASTKRCPLKERDGPVYVTYPAGHP